MTHHRLALPLSLALCLSLPMVVVYASEPAAASTTTAVAQQVRTMLERDFPQDAPGVAVLVARGDTVLYRGAHGRADLAAGTPLKPGDRFRIGSITKQFAAAGVLSLVEAGTVKLAEPVTHLKRM